MFDQERLLAAAKVRMGRSAGDVQEGLLSERHRFLGDAPQSGGTTVVVVARE
jgi:hypothetical protein